MWASLDLYLKNGDSSKTDLRTDRQLHNEQELLSDLFVPPADCRLCRALWTASQDCLTPVLTAPRACVCIYIVDTDNYVIAKHTSSRDVNFIPGDVIHGVALATAS